MKIATWNVNSIKARLPHVVEWLETMQPDVLLLQELKCTSTDFPSTVIEDIGYSVTTFGQKTYNGVAILSKIGIEDISLGNPYFEDPQARVIEAIVGGKVRVISVYVPNGQSVDSDKFTYKIDFLNAFCRMLQDRLTLDEALVVGGDYNIAPFDIDIYDPKAFADNILCSKEERKAFQELLDLGFTDSIRYLFPTLDKMYSWWDYRAAGFAKNKGARIDHILVSENALNYLKEGDIDIAPRGRERPSDHAPVWIELAI